MFSGYVCVRARARAGACGCTCVCFVIEYDFVQASLGIYRNQITTFARRQQLLDHCEQIQRGFFSNCSEDEV